MFTSVLQKARMKKMPEATYVNIMLDGRRITFPPNEQRPLVVGGRTLVLVRLVFEEMGFLGL